MEQPAWNDRYVDGDWVDVRKPSAIVRDAAPWLPAPGVALDLACGAGRNALFLAKRGWHVLAVDLSFEGLRRLAERAADADSAQQPESLSRGLPIQPALVDLEQFAVRPASFDLVINTRFLLRSLFPLIRTALRPGGLLLFETFSIHEIEDLGGDIRRAYVLEQGELLQAFPDFEILSYKEGVFEREEGERGLARLIARKRSRDRGPSPDNGLSQAI